ncbi:MAG: hypothetical protein KGO92_09830, partial [Bacteroidota bacterium]|nr:hypothetical protein [Bacteroidota bacterium]
KKEQVEILAKELLDKEVLHKSDVETLIGKRPFEEKKLIEIEEELTNGHPVGEQTFDPTSSSADNSETSIIG